MFNDFRDYSNLLQMIELFINTPKTSSMNQKTSNPLGKMNFDFALQKTETKVCRDKLAKAKSISII